MSRASHCCTGVRHPGANGDHGLLAPLGPRPSPAPSLADWPPLSWRSPQPCVHGGHRSHVTEGTHQAVLLLRTQSPFRDQRKGRGSRGQGHLRALGPHLGFPQPTPTIALSCSLAASASPYENRTWALAKVLEAFQNILEQS